MKLSLAIFLASVFCASLRAISWPPGEGQPGFRASDTRIVYDAYDRASVRTLGSPADSEQILKIPLPHQATLVELRWVSPTTAIAKARKRFLASTTVTYFIVFERMSKAWTLRSYYVGDITCPG